jgi:hypothetical protein
MIKWQTDDFSVNENGELMKWCVDEITILWNEKLTKGKLMKWQVDEMTIRQNGKLTKWQVGQMASWQNVK